MSTLIEKIDLKFNTACMMPVGIATDGIGKVEYDKDDAKVVIVFENTSGESEDVVIRKGNSIQGTCDLTLTIGAGEKHAICVESGKFVNVSGEDKGMLVFEASANIKAFYIVLA